MLLLIINPDLRLTRWENSTMDARHMDGESTFDTATQIMPAIPWATMHTLLHCFILYILGLSLVVWYAQQSCLYLPVSTCREPSWLSAAWRMRIPTTLPPPSSRPATGSFLCGTVCSTFLPVSTCRENHTGLPLFGQWESPLPRSRYYVFSCGMVAQHSGEHRNLYAHPGCF